MGVFHSCVRKRPRNPDFDRRPQYEPRSGNMGVFHSRVRKRPRNPGCLMSERTVIKLPSLETGVIDIDARPATNIDQDEELTLFRRRCETPIYNLSISDWDVSPFHETLYEELSNDSQSGCLMSERTVIKLPSLETGVIDIDARTGVLNEN